MVQMNLEKNLRKEIQKKMEKGTGAAGPTPPPFRPSQQPGLPLPPLSPPCAAPASLHPAPATWRPYAGVVDAPRPTRLHLVGTLPRAPRPLHSVPAPLSLLPPLASATATVAAPPQRHRRRSSAAPRRPRQCPNLDAKTTIALAFVAVSFCACSTEVRDPRSP